MADVFDSGSYEDAIQSNRNDSLIGYVIQHALMDSDEEIPEGSDEFWKPVTSTCYKEGDISVCDADANYSNLNLNRHNVSNVSCRVSNGQTIAQHDDDSGLDKSSLRKSLSDDSIAFKRQEDIKREIPEELFPAFQSEKGSPKLKNGQRQSRIESEDLESSSSNEEIDPSEEKFDFFREFEMKVDILEYCDMAVEEYFEILKHHVLDLVNTPKTDMKDSTDSKKESKVDETFQLKEQENINYTCTNELKQTESETKSQKDENYIVADVKVDSPSDVKYDSPVDVKDDSPVDVKVDSPIDVKVDSPIDLKVDSTDDIKDSSSADVKFDSLADIKSDSPTDIKVDSPVEVKDDSPVDVRDDSPVDLKVDSTDDIKDDSSADFKFDSLVDVKSDSPTDVEVDFSAADVKVDSPADVDMISPSDIKVDIADGERVESPTRHLNNLFDSNNITIQEKAEIIAEILTVLRDRFEKFISEVSEIVHLGALSVRHAQRVDQWGAEVQKTYQKIYADHQNMKAFLLESEAKWADSREQYQTEIVRQGQQITDIIRRLHIFNEEPETPRKHNDKQKATEVMNSVLMKRRGQEEHAMALDFARQSKISELKLLIIEQQAYIQRLQLKNGELNSIIRDVLYIKPESTEELREEETVTDGERIQCVSDVLYCDQSKYIPNKSSDPDTVGRQVFNIGNTKTQYQNAGQLSSSKQAFDPQKLSYICLDSLTEQSLEQCDEENTNNNDLSEEIKGDFVNAGNDEERVKKISSPEEAENKTCTAEQYKNENDNTWKGNCLHETPIVSV